MRIGDIVTLRGREGLWIFAGMNPTAIPPLVMGKFIRASGPRDAITIGTAMASLVKSVSFAASDLVDFQGGTAIVESDDGETVVLTYGPHKVERAGTKFSHEGRVIHTDRAALVRENLSKFFNQENTTNVQA
jgi:hypothetical protein